MDRAGSDGCRLLRLPKASVKNILADVLGIENLVARQEMLIHVPIFSKLSGDELLRLAAVMEVVKFEEGEEVVREGKVGECMYIIEDVENRGNGQEGHLSVTIAGIGQVTHFLLTVCSLLMTF